MREVVDGLKQEGGDEDTKEMMSDLLLEYELPSMHRVGSQPAAPGDTKADELIFRKSRKV